MSKLLVICVIVITGLLAFGARAQEVVMTLGPTLLDECNNVAAAAQRTGHADIGDIQTCDAAISRSWSTAGEIANALVNRGTLHLVRSENDKAIGDFTRAIKEDPVLASAYNDRGVALSAQHRQAEAIADFSRALTLKPENPDQVLFNRAMAYEDTGDLKNAYLDYLAASELNPGWDQPAHQLARFNVRRSPGS